MDDDMHRCRFNVLIMFYLCRFGGRHPVLLVLLFHAVAFHANMCGHEVFIVSSNKGQPSMHFVSSRVKAVTSQVSFCFHLRSESFQHRLHRGEWGQHVRRIRAWLAGHALELFVCTSYVTETFFFIISETSWIVHFSRETHKLTTPANINTD